MQVTSVSLFQIIYRLYAYPDLLSVPVSENCELFTKWMKYKYSPIKIALRLSHYIYEKMDTGPIMCTTGFEGETGTDKSAQVLI